MTSHSDDAGLDAARPLADVRVVTIALNVPGPVTVERLVRYGAAVTTVLPPSGDPLEQYCPPWFADLHRGQQVTTLDLKSEVGRARMADLLDEADLLVTSSRASALRRLSVDFATLHERHPRLCQIDIVGHPGEGADIAGHDLTYQATEGLIRPPAMPTTLVADMFGAERAVSEALVALRVRDATGAGCRREVALSDAAHDAARPVAYGMTSAGGPLDGALPAYGIYAAQDGWIALAALEPHFERRARELLDVDGTAEAYAAVFATRPVADWQVWAAEHDVPLAPIHQG